MMRKFIISFSLLLIAAFFALAYFINQRIDPQVLKSNAIHLIETNFPNTKVNLDTIKLKLGFRIKLTITKMNVWPKEESQNQLPALDFENLEVMIPLATLLFGSGEIDVNLQNPGVNLSLGNGKLNLIKMLENNLKNADSNTFKPVQIENSKDELKLTMEFPEHFANTSINIRLSQAKINYTENDKNNAVIIEKIVIKNLGMKDRPAFEMHSHFSFELSDEVLDFDCVAIGQLEMDKLFSENKINIKSDFKIKDIKSSKSGLTIPEIRLESNLNYWLDGVVKSSLVLIAGGSNRIEADMEYSKRMFKFEKINGQVSIQNIFDYFSIQTWPQIELQNTSLKIAGNLEILNSGRIKNELVWSTDKEIDVNLDTLKLSGLFTGTIINEKWQISSSGKILEGLFNVQLIFDFPIGDEKLKFEKVSSLSMTSNFKNIKFSSDHLSVVRGLLGDFQTMMINKFKHDSSVDKKKEFQFPLLPEAKILIELVDSQLENKPLSWAAEYKINLNEFKTLKSVAKLGTGKVESISTWQLYQNQLINKRSSEFKNLDYDLARIVLPSLLDITSGLISGALKIDEVYSPAGDMKYSYEINADIKDGNFSSSKVKNFIETKLKNLMIKEKMQVVSTKFNSLKAKLKCDNQKCIFNKFDVISDGEKHNIAVKGRVAVEGTKGSTDFDMTFSEKIFNKKAVLEKKNNVVIKQFKGIEDDIDIQEKAIDVNTMKPIEKETI